MNQSELILPLVKNKKVLDIGCAGKATPENSDWLHGKISAASRFCVGLDINRKAIEMLQEEGYNVYHGDASNFELDESFEVIVMAKILEHLPNPGKALDKIRNHLKKNGILIVTALFPFYFSRIKVDEVDNAGPSDHLAYYTPRTFARLAARHGFQEKKVTWLREEIGEVGTFKGKLFLFLMNLFPAKWSSVRWGGIYTKSLGDG